MANLQRSPAIPTAAGGVSATGIAKWDGTTWSALGSGMGEDYPYVRALVLDAASNLYAGVTMADLKDFRERYGLNSRLVKRDGRLVEEVYRVGGKYGAQITGIVEHLEAALPYATPPMKKALEALIRFYRSGEEVDRKAYDIAWVRDRDSSVDTINGFVEVYMDARGMKGAWEVLVYYVNPEKTAGIRKLYWVRRVH